jgi:hypothetical protein
LPRKAKRKDTPEVIGFVGVGLDNDDGHHRLTRGANFVLVGGSHETHDQMTDTALHVNEALRKRGKCLTEATAEEIVDLFLEARAKQK